MFVTFNIGKKGLTNGFLDLLEKTFKKNELVRISILKSATRDSEEVKAIANKICEEMNKRLKKDFTFKIIGFKIFVRKWRKLKK